MKNNLLIKISMGILVAFFMVSTILIFVEKFSKKENKIVLETNQESIRESIKESISETKAETISETKVETVEETESETVAETETETISETTKEIVEVEKEIPYSTIDNYADTGGDSRVYQEGKNGRKIEKYEVIYKNGEEIERNYLDSEIVEEATDEIIERLVNEPIEVNYGEKKKQIPRWVVENTETGEKTYYYNQVEAFTAYEALKHANIDYVPEESNEVEIDKRMEDNWIWKH